MKRFYCFFLIFCYSSFGFSQLQNYSFNNYDINVGLSSNWITCILKDSRGYMWIGTRYGLNRFDGYSFRQYYKINNDVNSLSGNRITKIFEDRKGRIWFGTWQTGISLYNSENDRFITFSNNNDHYQTLKSGYIKDINEDNNGNLWIGNGDEGIMIYNYDKNYIYYIRKSADSSESIRSNRITSIIKDNKSNFWIATRDGYIDIINPVTFKATPVNLDENTFNAIKNTDIVLFIDSDSLLWIGSAGGGLFTYDTKSGQCNTYPQISNKSVLDIIQIDQDILIATDNGGINIYNKKNNTINFWQSNPFDPQSLKSNGIYDLLFDKQGLLWAATFDAGLQYSKSKTTPFRRYYSIPNQSGTLSHNNVSAICESEDGRIFVATDGGGVNEFFPLTGMFSRIVADTKYSDFNNDYITCLYYSDQKLYICAYEKKLYVYNLISRKVELLEEGYDNTLPNSKPIPPITSVWCVLKDSRGYIWAGTINNGLFRFDPKNKKVINYQHQSDNLNSISHNSIITMLEDKDLNLWIGTEGGGINLYNYKDDNFQSFVVSEDSRNSISSNSINSIFEDKDGILWIGTLGGGLNRFNKSTQSFVIYNVDSGLPSNIILDIMEDEENNLWISTTQGLCRFNKTNGKTRIFLPSDGLQSIQFSQTACLKSKDGTMYFGGVGGLNSFYPDHVIAPDSIVNLVFTDFKILNRSVRIEDEKLSKFKGTLSSNSPSVELTYKDYVFSIEFASLDYISPEKVKYKYMMEGFDENWNETGYQHRLITYTNLRGGNYTFYVKASKDNENWSEPIKMNIRVISPFWETIWFYISVILVVSIIILLFIKNRTRFFREQKSLLEKEVSLRTQEIKSQNEFIRQQNIELEKHRNQLEGLVEERTSDLIEAKKRAEKADKLKTSFLANMSHEIRTPMNAILGFANLIFDNENEISTSDRKKYLNIINNNGYSLLKLINDIIDISKIESDQLEVYKTDFNLVEFITKLYIEYTESISRFRNVQSTITLNTNNLKNLYVHSDEGRIRGVLINFIENAIKYTENGLIEIGIRDSDNNLYLYVKDDGIGIAAENHQLIFDRFTKIEDSKQRLFRGTGIGLYISKKIVEMLGYKINLISELGKGAEFNIEIPKNTLISLFEQKEIISGITQFDGKKKTVLIVEDEDDNFFFLNSVLQKANFNTLRAKDGSESIELCKKRKDIDIILMDIKLPIMNGIDATRHIRGFNIHIPIIAQTAYAMSNDKSIILEAGCNDYIAKPIERQKLFSILSKYL